MTMDQQIKSQLDKALKGLQKKLNDTAKEVKNSKDIADKDKKILLSAIRETDLTDSESLAKFSATISKSELGKKNRYAVVDKEGFKAELVKLTEEDNLDVENILSKLY